MSKNVAWNDLGNRDGMIDGMKNRRIESGKAKSRENGGVRGGVWNDFGLRKKSECIRIVTE